MTCDQVQLELKAYLDGGLSWWDAQKVKLHLNRCAVCNAECGSLAEFQKEFFADVETHELPEALRARLVALAPEPVATIPPRRMPTLAWGAVGGACLATPAAIYLRLPAAPATSRDASPSFASAPSAPKIESKVAVAESSENRVATSMAKPAPAFDAVAPRTVDLKEPAKSSFDKEPAKKSRSRGVFPISASVEVADVAVAEGTTDAQLIAAAKA